MSGNYAPPLISNIPLYAPLVTTVPDRLRFCQLGCENLTVLTVFGIDRIFAVLRFWMFSFFFDMVLWFLIDPNDPLFSSRN